MGRDPNKPVTVAEAREIACRYLGRREHSCKELTDKLARKGMPAEIIDAAVSELQSEGLASDRRFAESYARSRVSRLYGPLKIRAELFKRGVDSCLIDELMQGFQDDWQDITRRWVEKRAGSQPDRGEKARLYRSGKARGFHHEHIMNALDSLRSYD